MENRGINYDDLEVLNFNIYLFYSEGIVFTREFGKVTTLYCLLLSPGLCKCCGLLPILALSLIIT